MTEVGRITDGQGHVLIVGTGPGTVTLALLFADTSAVELTGDQAEDFAQLYVSACWQAGRQEARAPGGTGAS